MLTLSRTSSICDEWRNIFMESNGFILVFNSATIRIAAIFVFLLNKKKAFFLSLA